MKPVSSSPIRSSLLTRTSSNASSAVSDSSWPTLSSTRPTEKPSAPVSTPNSEIPFAFFSGDGPRRHHDEVGRAAVGDERLGAVEDPVVAVAHRGGLERGEVGAAGRLGHADRGEQLAGAERRQPARLLLVVGEVHEVRRHDVAVDADAARQRHVDLGELLGQHRVEPVVAGLGAAVLLGDLEPEEPLLARRQPEVAGQAVVGRVLVEVGHHLAVEELLDRAAEGLVVLVVDRRASCPRCYWRVTQSPASWANLPTRSGSGWDSGHLSIGLRGASDMAEATTTPPMVRARDDGWGDDRAAPGGPRDRRGRPAPHRLRHLRGRGAAARRDARVRRDRRQRRGQRGDAATGVAVRGDAARAEPGRGVRRVDVRRPGVADPRGQPVARRVLLDPGHPRDRRPPTSGGPRTSWSHGSSTTAGTCGP